LKALDLRIGPDYEPWLDGHTPGEEIMRRAYPMLPLWLLKRLHTIERRNYHRAKKQGCHAERIDFVGICWQRDFRCHHCGQNVDWSLELGQHPQGLSLEHITPLVVGGAHNSSNVTCAHTKCNQRDAAAFQGRFMAPELAARLHAAQQRRMLERGQLAGLIWPDKHMLTGWN
jgi:hypothetical protein